MRDILIRELNKDSDYISIKEISSQAWEPIYLHRKNIMDKDIFHSLYKDGHNNKANSLEKWCRENKNNVRLAEKDGKVIGFVTWEKFNNETIELSNNAVLPSFHGKGIGSQLYQWFFDFAKKKVLNIVLFLQETILLIYQRENPMRRMGFLIQSKM